MDDKGGGVGFEGGSGFKRASTDSNKTLVSSDDERGLIDGDLVIDKGKKSKAKSKPPVSFNPSSSPLSEKRSNHHHHPHHQKTIYILKTPLGHLIGFLFGPETLTIFLSGWLLTNLRDWYFRVDHVVDYLATIPDPFGRYPYVYVFLLQFLVQGAVSTAWAWPTRVRKLPLLVYGGVMLHQEMRRETTGKTHRRVLAGTKAMVAGYAALAVWMTGRMPARHEILDRPGLTLPPQDLAALQAEVCRLGNLCFKPLPNYQVFDTSSQTAFDDKIMILARQEESGEPIAFVSTVILPVSGHNKPTIHTGLTTIHPDHRKSGIIHNLFSNLFIHIFSLYPEGVWLNGEPSEMHLQIAREISARHRAKMYVPAEAGFDEKAFVFRRSKNTLHGPSYMKDSDDSRYWHRERELTEFYRKLLVNPGDEVLQISYLDPVHVLEAATQPRFRDEWKEKFSKEVVKYLIMMTYMLFSSHNNARVDVQGFKVTFVGCSVQRSLKAGVHENLAFYGREFLLEQYTQWTIMEDQKVLDRAFKHEVRKMFVAWRDWRSVSRLGSCSVS
ncbi:uncharacterized protein BCR38DRAFT_489560 [Pseudomassariella vexata]|uniref:Uncharacterized protein n=1 Tax=Pseudomassariella vexata TaxID=1141098 RepID=A0A1Y2DG68_9PEZI|nr:uncharacterized protein BCR38DRAFT_489560 [Pseudomassariella vexata]ORY58074.1 hypothetical protein BCR38DRAFT_489560 [Pseudomassariella vexata]